jgi:hypothetical protein
VYNLYKTSNNDSYKNIENFVSNLKGLNNKKKKKNNFSNTNSDDNDNSNSDSKLDFKKSLRKLKSKKSGTTFDDLFKATENMDPDKLSFENMKNELIKYNNSFRKEKFKNNSKSTAESFEKFQLYKEKFFEIFK